MKVLAMITLRGSHKLLRVGSIRSPAALPRMAVRGRAFLSEQANDNRVCYYKGGLAEGVTRRLKASAVQIRSGRIDFAIPPYELSAAAKPAQRFESSPAATSPRRRSLSKA
jgi:hypothetical protein